MKELLTLGIDTSCDETSASVVRGVSVLSNVMPSQMEFHKKYGGVVPSLAKLAHQERIDNVIKEALSRAKVAIEEVDIIAVTFGPGLAIALEIGVNKAKELAKKYKKPLIAINHMEGHMLSGFAQRNTERSKFIAPKFPVLGVLVSGNHTELIHVKGFSDYQKIGETLDDSCGEAYDKCGRILGFGYPAGPTISKLAKEHRKNVEIKIFKYNLSTLVKITNLASGKEYQLPVAMANSGDLNFSYSGLKTAFKQLVESLTSKKLTHQDEVNGVAASLTQEEINDLCVLIETAALSQLVIKVEKALEKISYKEIWLGGGVVASSRLRLLIRNIAKKYKLELRYPYSNKLIGDNAAMIALVANINFQDKRIEHNLIKGIYLKDYDLLDRDPSVTL